MEQTLVLLKPDTLPRQLVGKIITRFEEKGLKIIKLKMLKLSVKQVENLYEEHVEKGFFGDLLDYMTSGPIIALIIEGHDAINTSRRLIGDTGGTKPGTIRGDWAQGITKNLVHGSDSPARARREIALLFPNK